MPEPVIHFCGPASQFSAQSHEGELRAAVLAEAFITALLKATGETSEAHLPSTRKGKARDLL